MSAIVTGAASGIGKRMVDEFVRRGQSVLATDVDPNALSRTASEQAWPDRLVRQRVHDVRDPDSWQRTINEAVQSAGRLDVLLNVAGVIRPEYVDEMKPENIALQIDVNTKGVILGTSTAARVMVEQGRGHIVNIASMAALAPVPGIAVYTASKFAVRGFSLAVAQELIAKGVRVSVVCPDAVETPMVDYQVDFPQAAMTFSGGRMLTADEVVRAVFDRVLDRGRFELALPWHRAFIARWASVLPPWAMLRLSKGLARKGRQKQIERFEKTPSKATSDQ